MLLKIENVKIEILSAVVSKNRVPVEERLKNLITEKKISRLKKSTGFGSFSVVEKNICTSDLCFAAAEKIFAETNINRSDIKATIFVSQTSDYFLPSTAHTLQSRLNISRESLAFDINLGCSGFVYGLYVAASIIQNLPEGKILLMCGETPSKCIFPEDISALTIFGDAGTATIISKSEGEKIFFNLQTFGELANVIIIPDGAYRNMPQNLGRDNFVHMDGAAVMDFSIKYVPQNLIDLMDFAKIDSAQVESFLMHQANKLILQNIAAKLNVPEEKVLFNAGKIGNTSSASIPVVLTELKTFGREIKSLAVLSGFGVGMSVASAVVDLKNLICLPTGEF